MWNNPPSPTPLWRFPLATLVATLLIVLSVGPAGATDFSAALSGPVRVELHDGRSFSGQAVSYRGEILLVRTRIDGGEVERGFPRDHISRVHFPGERLVAEGIAMIDDGEEAEALPLLEALWRQRANFLPLASPEVMELLAFLPAIHREQGDPYRAIALARNLLPHARAALIADRLHETILLAHYQLEFFDDTEKLAREWVRAQSDFPASALGWKILGDLALRNEDFERVAWIALQPIVMAGPENGPHLDGCYALAIHAFHQKKEPERARQLYLEMVDRGLTWPDDPGLAETGLIYQAHLPEGGRPGPDQPEPDLDLRPPEEDLNLPLDQVRKILRTEEP